MTQIRDNAFHKMWHVTNPLSLNAQELYFVFQHKQELLRKGFANKILRWKKLIRHKDRAQQWIPLLLKRVSN